MYGAYGKPILIFEAFNEWAEGVEEGTIILEADMRADFPSFLYGPVRTALWHGYTKVEPQYRRYARVDSVSDFRPTRIRGLNSLTGVGYVGEHGEYPGMKRTERPSASVQVDTYGGVYAITRHAIVNDDTGELLNRNPSEMGFAIGNYIAEAMIAVVENPGNAPDGAAFFSSGRGNQGTAALSEDSLPDAITAMENQRDDDNYRIIVRPQTVLVPTVRLELIGKRILNSSITGTNVQWTGGAGAGSAIFDKGIENPIQGILPADAVVREPFLTDQTDWYVLANPDDVPAFTIAFLNGAEQPFIGLKNPEVRGALGAGNDPYTFEFDTIDFKVRHDFGFGVIDPRGAYKNVVAG
jgi:hypothetical protein